MARTGQPPVGVSMTDLVSLAEDTRSAGFAVVAVEGLLVVAVAGFEAAGLAVAAVVFCTGVDSPAVLADAGAVGVVGAAVLASVMTSIVDAVVLTVESEELTLVTVVVVVVADDVEEGVDEGETSGAGVGLGVGVVVAVDATLLSSTVAGVGAGDSAAIAGAAAIVAVATMEEIVSRARRDMLV